MSWLLRNSPLRQSFNRSNRGRSVENAPDCDPKACYDSFCKHWQQVYEIILRAEPNKPSEHDDVLGVVNHLDHMVTLLLVELHNCNKNHVPGLQATIPSAQCLEFMLSENLLDKLYEWGKSTGRYANAVRLEQIKLYELLLSHSRHQLLVHEPFLRPLLKLLASSQGEQFPADIEKRLVILLNQLCVVLMQNVHLLDLFFFSSSTQQENAPTNFIIFSLLIPYVHRDGSLGHQARDALLLCMALSQKNSNVGTYIAKYSSMCPFLVTGLGGSYSSLPNSIEITTSDWHRITPDDVADIPELTLFMNSLEFCNAVVQVAHQLIREQLLSYMYQGFIKPILGPALLQNNTDSQISAMAYLELILRSVNEPGLQKVFIQFLLDEEKFDGQRILDILVERINSTNTRLCMVTISLFDTLLSLHSEDIMLELMLKYLFTCKHIPATHRHKVNQVDYYGQAADYFLELSPEVMKQTCDSQAQQQIQPMSKTIGANWNHYSLNTGDSLYANYHAYLYEARARIARCQSACEQWSNGYRYDCKRSDRTADLIRDFLSELGADADRNGKQMDSLQSLGESSGYESFKYRPEDENCGNGGAVADVDNTLDAVTPELQQQQQQSKRKLENCKTSGRRQVPEISPDIVEDSSKSKPATLGPFINAIWTKLETFTSNCLYVNLHLTGLISRIVWYPLPLVQTIFSRPDLPFISDIPPFHQVLKILKQQIDAELPVSEECLELIDMARSTLIEREIRLINARKNAIETLRNPVRIAAQPQSYQPQSATSNISAATPPQANVAAPYDAFRRNDSKRKSLTTSLSNMFKKPTSNNSFGPGATSLNTMRDTNATSSAEQPTPLDSSGTSSTNTLSLDQLANSLTNNRSSSILIGADRIHDLAVCAVILDEWFKELSAIANEQSIAMLKSEKEQ